MFDKYLKRDLKIELLRVFACLFVVIIHSYLPLYHQDYLSYKMLVLYAIVGCANTIFFFITGAFWYEGYLENKNYLDVLKKFFKSVFLPTFLFSVLFAILDPFIYGYEGSILKYFNPLDFKMIIIGLLTHNFNAISGSSLPYWYVFEFAGLLLFYPIIAYLTHKKQDKILLFIVIVSFVQCLINDLSIFPMLNTILGKLTFPFIPTSLAFTILGYLTYKYKDEILKKTNILIGIIIYLFAFVLQVILEIFILRIDRSVTRFFYWDSFLAFISVIGLFIIVYSIKDEIIDKFKSIITFISKRSFYVFLFHYAVLMYLTSIGLRDNIVNSFKPLSASLIISLLVFIICLILASFVLLIKGLFKRKAK